MLDIGVSGMLSHDSRVRPEAQTVNLACQANQTAYQGRLMVNPMAYDGKSGKSGKSGG